MDVPLIHVPMVVLVPMKGEAITTIGHANVPMVTKELIVKVSNVIVKLVSLIHFIVFCSFYSTSYSPK